MSEKFEQMIAFYEASNEMLCKLAMEGEIDTRNPLVDKFESAMYDIDGGIYTPEDFREFLRSMVIDETTDDKTLDLFSQGAER